MKVEKRTWIDAKTGEKKVSPYYSYRDKKGRWHSLRVTQKDVAIKKCSDLIIRQERQGAGLCFNSIQQETIEKNLDQLLEEYIEDIKTRGKTKGYYNLVRSRCQLVFKKCRWKQISHIEPGSFLHWRAGHKARGKTLNDYLGAVTSFLGWLQSQRKIECNPLANIKKADQTKSRFRRSLTSHELQLISDSQAKYRLLYLVACFTGLRKGELKQLQWDDIREENGYYVIHARACTTKNKKEAIQPLPNALATELLDFKPKNPVSGLKVFRTFPAREFFKKELKQMGIPYQDASGRYADFHSFRHTYCTLLQKSGASQRIAQQLMRHSDPKLTANTYTDSTQLPTLQAVQGLPYPNKKNPSLDKPLDKKPNIQHHIMTADDINFLLNRAAQEDMSQGFMHDMTANDTEEQLMEAPGIEPGSSTK